MTAILGLLLIAAALYLAYLAGAHDRHAADWQAKQVAARYADAMAAGRSRHPGGRDR